ncbi:WD40-repeat-containing domain protein [Fennellomyces sp. T-0311]|nr:WD40-repeat-containing domain protein [Fennellomyces sp. T-0311]
MRAIHGRRIRGQTIHVPGRPLLERFTCQEKDTYRFYYPDGRKCVPFVCSYSHHGPLLAVGDEERRVSLIRTDKDSTIHNASYHSTFYTHSNAVLDIKWSNDDELLMTGSADCLIRLWDVGHEACVGTMRGHLHSLRSANFHPTNPHLIISASMDGSFMIWDTRYNLKQQKDPSAVNGIGADAPVYAPIKTALRAHFTERRPLESVKKPERSVTAAYFVPHHEDKVITSGSYDGKIKIWDCRTGRDARPIDEWVAFNRNQSRARGIADLKIDSTGTRLYSLSMDHIINMHYINNLSQPARRFVSSDQTINTFFVKMALSADDRYLLCGSSKKVVYAWDVERPQSGPVLYEGHGSETTSMSWCSNTAEFASCSDDGSLRIWKYS